MSEIWNNCCDFCVRVDDPKREVEPCTIITTRLTVMIPKDRYNWLLQRKPLNGTAMSQTLVEVLDRRPPMDKK